MVITDVTLCDANGEREAQVRVENGKIVEVGARLAGEPRISGNGAYLMPGMIDSNVRLTDGQLNAKNLEKLSVESLAGGVLNVVLAPDSTPAVDNTIVLEFVQSHRGSRNGAKLETAICALNEEKQLSNIAILLKKGAIAPYLSADSDTNQICRVAEYVKMYGTTLMCKPEDASLSSCGVMADGAVASALGLAGISPVGEVTQVARMIEVARHYGIRVLFKSVSSPRSVEMTAAAKAKGVNVACEVSLHHLLHCDEACSDFNTTAKIDPPLAPREAMTALQEALKNGAIDMLTTLHQPNSLVNKEVAFFDASYGSASIADALPLYYTKLVKSGLISLPKLAELTMQKPAELLGLGRGVIEPGEVADLVLFDPNAEYRVEESQSLYNKERLSGRVIMAIRSGEPIRL